MLKSLKGGMDNKKSSSDWSEIFVRGVFWGLEFESGLRFFKFSSEVGESDLPQGILKFRSGGRFLGFPV